MKTQHLKYYIGIILIFFIDILHLLCFDNVEKYDVYIFYNYDRYLTNIVSDFSNYFRFSILTFWLISLNKVIFKPLFIMSIVAFITYFIDYNQGSSIGLIPVYLLSVIYYNKKSKIK